MRKDLFVYLSGPMTAKHGVLMEENVAAGLRVHLDLLRMGIPNFCPQLSGAFPSAWSDVPYDRWIEFDFAVIDRCTHVLMLPRWETEQGRVTRKGIRRTHRAAGDSFNRGDRLMTPLGWLRCAWCR